MSKSGRKERSNFRGGGGADADADADNGDEDDPKEQRDHVWGKNVGKAKKTVSFLFRKAKKRLVHSGRQKSRSTSYSGEREESFVGGCSLCFKRPRTMTMMESPTNNSQKSDPNSPAFTYEHLKLVIENNDFYSKECNPHIGMTAS